MKEMKTLLITMGVLSIIVITGNLALQYHGKPYTEQEYNTILLGK